MSVAAPKFLQEAVDDVADRVVGCSHAEEDLHRAGILLREPTSQAGFGGCIAPLEWLEHGDTWLRGEG